MKRSLLLISFLYAIAFSAYGQKLVSPSAKPQSETRAAPVKHAVMAKSNKKKKTVRHTVRNKKEIREIIHTAPDQQKIDSIKKEKMKHKK